MTFRLNQTLWNACSHGWLGSWMTWRKPKGESNCWDRNWQGTQDFSSLLEDFYHLASWELGIKILFCAQFVAQCSIEFIPGVMHFVNKVETTNEEHLEKYITSALSSESIKTDLYGFVFGLLTVNSLPNFSCWWMAGLQRTAWTLELLQKQPFNEVESLPACNQEGR